MNNFLLTRKKVLAVCMETTAGGRNYSGGLGALYGDTTRTMLRLGAGFLAVTPLYKNGYVQQKVTGSDVIDEYPEQDLSIDYEDTGIVLLVPLLGKDLKIKVWKNRVMSNHYGLDASDNENGIFSEITNNLYGENGIGIYDGEAQRLMQEVILGVGAVMLCDKIHYNFDILHLNEGHGVFAALYLIKRYMGYGTTFENAWKQVRRKTVFTTHTPISAGNKSRPIQTIIDLGANQGLTYEQLQAIGSHDNAQLFGSTVAALRLSKVANAVAFRHQATSHELWNGISDCAPIIYIDNGVDIRYWQDSKIKRAYNDASQVSLLMAHKENKRVFINEINKRNGVKLNENSIIIGFARRAIEYKRADMIFADPERFEKLVKDYNLQIVFSGKTHPKDWNSKQILKRLYQMTQKYPNNVVFIQNYDVEVAGLMTKGCDVWLGNPQIPLEACSTSGMKAACNGVLNLSTPDGWWYKSARHKVNGWVIGDSISHDYYTDANYLYEVLEKDVLPTYSDSTIWAKMMMSSIYTAEEECSTDRMCRDYYAYLYCAPFYG